MAAASCPSLGVADNCVWVTKLQGNDFKLVDGADPICGEVLPGVKVSASSYQFLASRRWGTAALLRHGIHRGPVSVCYLQAGERV